MKTRANGKKWMSFSDSVSSNYQETVIISLAPRQKYFFVGLGNQSIPTEDLPSTTLTDTTEPGQQEQLLLTNYGTRTTRVPAAPIRFGGKRKTPNRVGWDQNRERKIICYSCCKINKHIKPECNLQISEMDQVISNYETLSADEKSRVPDNSYKAAKTFMGLQDTDKANQTNIMEHNTQPESKN